MNKPTVAQPNPNPPTSPSAHQNARLLATMASCIMAMGVGLGAFGAHGLKKYATPYALEIWQTATLYLFLHGGGIFVVAALCAINVLQKRHAIFFMLGIVLFCGSLYALALNAPKPLGIITPIGGVCFIIGWLWVAVGSLPMYKR